MRLLLAIFTMLAGLAAGAARANGIAIVLNSGDATLSLLDMARGAELRRIPVLREPHHVALSPDGRDLLVGDAGANENERIVSTETDSGGVGEAIASSVDRARRGSQTSRG